MLRHAYRTVTIPASATLKIENNDNKGFLKRASSKTKGNHMGHITHGDRSRRSEWYGSSVSKPFPR